MIHHRQRLPLRSKRAMTWAESMPGLDDLQGHPAAHGLVLLGQVDRRPCRLRRAVADSLYGPIVAPGFSVLVRPFDSRRRLKERLFQEAAGFLMGLQQTIDDGPKCSILSARGVQVGGRSAGVFFSTAAARISSAVIASDSRDGCFPATLQCDRISPRAP